MAVSRGLPRKGRKASSRQVRLGMKKGHAFKFWNERDFGAKQNQVFHNQARVLLAEKGGGFRGETVYSMEETIKP